MKPILRRTLQITGFAAATTLVVVGLNAGRAAPSPPAHTEPHPVPVALLQEAIPDSTPNAVQLRRGQYLVAAGDCLSCHLREGGESFAGGLPLKTPFGTIYSANITSDRETGIGGWSNDQFYRAMHDGIDDQGANLYPAFPYPWFRAIDRADDDAIFAYLKSLRPVTYTPPANDLPFPFNFRFLVKGWNLLFLKTDPSRTDPAQSTEWNRGAYLVSGPGHCSACHTPKNLFGADKSDRFLQGGVLDLWVAPDLTGNERTGLGRWSVDEIAELLKTGRNAHAETGGSMADVINYSTALMTDQDRHAIAVYLKGVPPSAAVSVADADAGAMKRGAAIYQDACTGCHLENGVGQPRYFPPLGNNAIVQQSDPTSVEHSILAGNRIGAGPSLPSQFTMPSFAWKLTDAEVADVSTFVRNSWGNRAAPVSSASVGEVRKKLGLDQPRSALHSTGE